jgi:hypothetical protein
MGRGIVSCEEGFVATFHGSRSDWRVNGFVKSNWRTRKLRDH